jgi:hypothetical protein
VTENRPNKNSSSAKMANNDSAGRARSGAITPVAVEIQRQSNHAPPASSSSNSTPKPGTKNFSNCSRARCAGKTSASFASNSVEPPLLLVSSSSSSFSSRSFSSSRIWNQLMKAISAASPRKIDATCPARELA